MHCTAAAVGANNCKNRLKTTSACITFLSSPCSGTFDFFYLPIDFRNKCNLGYCFVNFLDAGMAGRLYRDFHQKRWEEYNSKKVGRGGARVGGVGPVAGAKSLCSVCRGRAAARWGCGATEPARAARAAPLCPH